MPDLSCPAQSLTRRIHAESQFLTPSLCALISSIRYRTVCGIPHVAIHSIAFLAAHRWAALKYKRFEVVGINITTPNQHQASKRIIATLKDVRTRPRPQGTISD